MYHKMITKHKYFLNIQHEIQCMKSETSFNVKCLENGFCLLSSVLEHVFVKLK